MSVTYSWHDENQTILHVEFVDKWAWDDMYQIRDSVLDDYTGNDTVYIIADFRETNHIPGNAMAHGTKALEKMHPNQGLQIFIGAPTALQKMFEIAKTFMPKVIAGANFTFADSFDDALGIIEDEKV